MILTGIKATGDFHLGNYVSMIKPIEEFSKKDKCLVFLADYHSITIPQEQEKLRNNIKSIQAILLSFFEYNDNVIIYRQSQIPQIFELNFILSCFCEKGILNRAHAYKALVEKNKQKNKDPDKGVLIGLYTYPVLMAADILLFQPDLIPVGKDQVSHIEIMNDIAQKINSFYKTEIFTKFPQPFVQRDAVLPGIDGRKMSKSYNNIIPLFDIDEKKLKKLIFSICTNSKNVGEPKFENESYVTEIFKFLSDDIEYEHLINEMKNGIGWGEVKQMLFDKIQNLTHYKIKEREKFLYTYPNAADLILRKNEERLRILAKDNLDKIKTQIGIN